MAQQVDAHATEEVAALRSHLAADRLTDRFLQLEIPRRPTRHRHRNAVP